MLKVLHVVLGLEVGGLERFVIDLMKNMPESVSAGVACLGELGVLGEAETSLTRYALHMPPGLHPGYGFRLARLVRAHGYDVIHTHNKGPHPYGALAAVLSGRPLVHTKHGRNAPGNPRKVMLNRLASRFTARIVAVSQDAAEVSALVERVPRKKIVTILNGVDATLYSPGVREGILSRERGIPPEAFRLGIVARLAPEKDHENLLRACSVLKGEGADFHLVVIGDGMLREGLERLVAELGLGDRVHFLGMRRDIPNLLRELDLFVLSSVTEGLSLTLLEAMAACLPVVATDVGGNAEAVADGLAGWIVPPRDPLALAEGIRHVLCASDRGRAMGRAGRERVLERFGIRETARAYADLYRQVAG